MWKSHILNLERARSMCCIWRWQASSTEQGDAKAQNELGEAFYAGKGANDEAPSL